MSATRSIKHYQSEKTLQLVALDFLLKEQQLEELAQICNSSHIYKVLFEERLKGREYQLEDAQQFNIWANTGWEKKSWFVFLLLDDQKIAGAIDIKGTAPRAEVGYWMSLAYPGFITQALVEICIDAKKNSYQELYATTIPGNTKSQQVLKRADFKQLPSDDKPTYALKL